MLAWSLIAIFSQPNAYPTTTALPQVQFSTAQLCDQAAQAMKQQWTVNGQRYVVAICVRTQ